MFLVSIYKLTVFRQFDTISLSRANLIPLDTKLIAMRWLSRILCIHIKLNANKLLPETNIANKKEMHCAEYATFMLVFFFYFVCIYLCLFNI